MSQRDNFIPHLFVAFGENGSFTLNNAPAGESSLVAGYKGTGSEIIVNLQPGQTVDVGTITISVIEPPEAE